MLGTKQLSAACTTLLAAVVTLHSAVAQPAEDASTYPSKVIRIIVPFAPGGPNDILARLISDELSRKWSATIVVDNRPGGGTIIGTQVAARSPADGYTLLMASFSTAANVSLKKSLPFDTVKDFTPVIHLGETPNVLVTGLDSGVHTVADLVALAKKSPGQISYGTGGIGTSTDLAGHLLCLSTGTKMIAVPYKGDGPALVDMLGGRITWMFATSLPVMPYISSGKLRPVAVSGAARSAALPNVPTVAETVPNFNASSWYGMLAPAGTPAPIVAKLNTAINDILSSQKINEFLEQQGARRTGGAPAAFAAYLSTEIDKWAKVIKEAGIEPQ